MRGRHVLLSGLAIGLCSLNGCITPIDLAANAGLGVAQAGTSIYSQGTLQAAFNVPMERVIDAIGAVMTQLQYSRVFEDVREPAATLNFAQSDGSVISIRTKRSSPTVTGLSVRVGFWGDPAVSRLILDRITEQVSRPVPQTVPDQ